MNNKLLLSTIAITALLSSCGDKDYFDEERYNQMIEDAFPIKGVSKDQTWATSRVVSASVSTSKLSCDAYTMNIYDKNPMSEGSKLLSTTTVEGGATVNFNLPYAAGNYVFVTMDGQNGREINGYFKVSDNNTVTIGTTTRAATTEQCNTTITREYETTAEFWIQSLGKKDTANVTFAHLGNVKVVEGDTWQGKDWLDIVDQKTGVFREYNNNLYEYRDKMGSTVEYTTGEETPIALSLNFGATQNKFKIGYFYYKDGEDPNEAKRYVLLDKYTPADYITIDGQTFTDGMKLASLGQQWGVPLTAKITGSKISLVYFDQNGNASYNFPKGIHIAFFICKTWNDNVDPYNVWNSTDKVFCSPYLKEDKTKLHTCAVTYGYGGQTVLGFEDGSDWDMNDLLFFVSGNISNKPEDIKKPVAEPEKYTFCFEDNFPEPGDYDFNDVVARVSMQKFPCAAGSEKQRDTLEVTIDLTAVGATKQIASALRLVGVNADMVEGKYKLDDSFHPNPNNELKDIIPWNEKKGKEFLTQREGEGTDIYIPLFNDAHYAINGGTYEYQKYFYNTLKDANHDRAQYTDPKRNVYRIIFKDNKEAFNNFSAANLDLFIIEGYNGSWFEVHTYPYKNAKVIHNYPENNVVYPWALMIPGNFKYPYEFVQIGSYLNGVKKGAYQTDGHSFAEWALDPSHNTATDWYNYPMSGLVWEK